MGGGYRNGEVPESWLIRFHSGYNAVDGYWYHSLPPSTYRKHLALVKLAKRNTGHDLRIGDGWCAYRPIEPQRMLKKRLGIMAATPGTSSHGLFWEGAQVAAIDYSNWSQVYAGDRAAWFRDVRAVGLVPDMISPRRGYPDEPWHVIDTDPWAPVPAGEVEALPSESEEDDMKPDSMFAIVDGVPSWCWLNWGKGTLFAVHDQGNADIVGEYMGSVNDDWGKHPEGGRLYKNKLALFGILCPSPKIDGVLTEAQLAQIQARVAAGVKDALAGSD